ncbi:hypothetical protein DY000_02017579 [Brassica cretica]|uniref:Uncharacterized protein n=1 Tax=Brassica cretica TaxID=69181 RepID=A0ABQ7CML0_BRACR|nr:hypothetical protein DY000_02017579 [Brassica cretica]
MGSKWSRVRAVLRSPKSGLASLPPADWSFRLLRPSSFRRKPSAVACLSDALQPILLCGTSVMGPELSRITSASISMSLTCSSSPGLFVLGGTHMDTPCRLLEWTTSRVDFTGSRWPDQGLVSLASPVAPVGVAFGMVCGSLDHSPVESSIDLCCLMQFPASCLFRDLLKLNVCSWQIALISFLDARI